MPVADEPEPAVVDPLNLLKRGIKDPALAVPDRAKRPEELLAPTYRSLPVAALVGCRCIG
jgi:hypothetical protein